MRTEPSEIQAEPERMLAVRVLEQALVDLSGDAAGQREAEDFLRRRLWQPWNLWGQWLAPMISPQRVAAVIERAKYGQHRYQRKGRHTPKPEKQEMADT